MLQYFPGSQKDEKIIMVIRKHPIVYIRIFLVFLGVTVVPVFYFFLFWSKIFPLFEPSIAGIIGYLSACLYFLYSLMVLMIAIIDEMFDLFILTDHRLIDVTQVTFLKRTVATTPLNQIQDTTSRIQGLLGTLMNYGTVDVKTAAGMASTFYMDHVPDPGTVARLILNQAEERREKDLMMRDESDKSD